MKDMFKKFIQLFKNAGLITLLAILGALGGQGIKWVRRFLYPGIITIYAIYVTHNLWCLSIYLLSFVLSIGYGIPQAYKTEPNTIFNPNEINFKIGFEDEGSALGRFFYKIFKGNMLLTNSATRAVIGCLISASLISIPILTWNWITYFLGSLIIILIWALVSWRGFGETPIKIFNKQYNLLNVDLVVYGVTSASILGIVYGVIG
jgi:hypothetical protein